MRHYHRADFRHLSDGERYRDYDYVADDGFIGPNERAPYGYAHEGAPPWSTLGEWETRAFAGRSDDDTAPLYYQPQGRDRGLSHGYDDNHPHLRNQRVATAYDGPPQPNVARGRHPQERHPQERHGFFQTLLHPRQAMQRAVHGLFHGKGPKNWVRSEQRIHDEVCERLAHHHDVDASDIEVTVKEGEITLTGTVSDRRMKSLAEDVIEDLVGVEDVHNRLKVKR